MADNKTNYKLSFLQAFLILASIVALIVWFVGMKISISIPLMLSWLILYVLCKGFKLNFGVVMDAGLDALRKIAGSVLCAAMIGNKMTPIADTPVLSSSLTGSDLFKVIKCQLYTTIPAALIAGIIFFVSGFQYGNVSSDSTIITDVLGILENQSHISVITLLPIIVMIGLMIKKVPSVPSILGGAVVAVLVATFYQGYPVDAVFGAMIKGFRADVGHKVVNSILNQGGLLPMSGAIFTMVSAVVFGGMIHKMGLIDALLQPIVPRLNSRTKIAGATLFTTYFVNLTTSASYLSHIVTAEFFNPIYKEKKMAPEMLARAMAEGVAVTMLLPWHNMTVYFMGVLGVTWFELVPYAYVAFLLPLFHLLSAITGIGWVKGEGDIDNKSGHVTEAKLESKEAKA